MRKVLLVLLVVLSFTTTIEFDAAEKDVRIAYDSKGKVDYKNFYENGQRVRYEDWDNGHKIQVKKYYRGQITSRVDYNKSGVRIKLVKYKNGYVTSKYTYNNNGTLTNKQTWSGGDLLVTTTYKGSKITKQRKYDYNGNILRIIDGNRQINYAYNGRRGSLSSRVIYENGRKVRAEAWNMGYIKTLTRYNADNTATRNEYTSSGRLYEKKYYTNQKLTRAVSFGAEKGNYSTTNYSQGGYVNRKYRSGKLYSKSDCRKGTQCATTYYNKEGALTSKEYLDDPLFVTEYYKNGEITEIDTMLGGHAFQKITYDGNQTILELIPYYGGESVWIQKSYLGVPYSSKQYDSNGKFIKNTPSYYGEYNEQKFLDFVKNNDLFEFDYSDDILN